MKIYQTAEWQVRPEAVEKCAQAVRDFVDYVRANEPGTEMYLAWQRQDDPTRFLHFFIFADEAAQTTHSESAAVAKFEETYRPELVGGDVVFTDFNLVARN
ncbi:MAG TPA: antibiotic biosynthesis monooxygenase family protein [Candidatus Solibacter sp.]|jgi:quinol monooxygenase YgiN|nr:antibiotic biosynthesis monooxygenase family protein [Candidatus Solibacter sp.]